jgi:hypothetical protein
MQRKSHDDRYEPTTQVFRDRPPPTSSARIAPSRHAARRHQLGNAVLAGRRTTRSVRRKGVTVDLAA